MLRIPVRFAPQTSVNSCEIDGKVCQVIDFMHVKPGKGAAFVRVKLKDIINGGVVHALFNLFTLFIL